MAQGGIENVGEQLDFEHILQQGNGIQAYLTGGSLRVARILDHLGSSDAKLLGYGTDTSIEGALIRARDSFEERESLGHDQIAFTEEYAAFRSHLYTTDADPQSELDGYLLHHGMLRAEVEDDQVLLWDLSRGREGATCAPTLAVAAMLLCAQPEKDDSYLL